MIQLLIRLCLGLLVINLLATQCSAWNSRGSGKTSRGYEESVKNIAHTGNSEDIPRPTTARKGPAISAWGIVILVVAMILAVTGVYYFSICYPSICRKNTKYDLMAVPTLA